MKKNVKVVAMLSTVLIILLMPLQGKSQEVSPNKVIVGTELDLLPYITGGYYGSLVLGYDCWRVRGIVTRTSPPEFVVADGFNDYELEVKAFLIDRFFGKSASSLEGFWVGAGMEFWKHEAKNKLDGVVGNFNSTVATLGAGYVWSFNKHFYLNPWAAVHVIVGGDTEKAIGNNVYKTNTVTPEASLKLGWYF